MKWIAFGLFATFCVPCMFALATSHPRWRSILFGVLLASTAVGIDVNFFSLEHYRGPDRGFQIGMSDFLAISLGAALLVTKPGQIRWIPSGTLPMIGYFVVAIIASLHAPFALAALFTLFKLAKGYVIYWCAYNYCRIEMSYRSLWWGLVSICVIEAVIVLKQKYLMGLYRVHGTFDHSNTIPAFMLLIIPMLLAWVLVERHWSQGKTTMTIMAMLGACVCVVASLSRAGIGLMGCAIMAITLTSFLRGFSIRRMAIASLLGMIVTAGGVKSADTLIQRFQEAPESSGEARDEFNWAADMMAAENFWGVGLNCFSHVLTNTPRYREQITVMKSEKHAGVCHHIYRLTAAEMGRIGLFFFVLIMARFLWSYGLACLGPPTVDRALAFSVLIGSCALHIIGLLEWVFRVTPVMHLFLLVSAIGMAAAERARKPERVDDQTETSSPPTLFAPRLATGAAFPAFQSNDRWQKR